MAKKIKAPQMRVLYQTKKNPQVKDPVRFPKVINPLENEFKKSFAIEMNKMLVDLTKKMVELKK